MHKGDFIVTPQFIQQDITESLSRLRTDSIDLYLLHRDEPKTPVETFVETMNLHIADGHIDAWADSDQSLAGPSREEDRRWHGEREFAVFSYSTLSRGFLSGRVTREGFQKHPGIVDSACRRAYCHEVNFRRLDRAYEMAERKRITVTQITLGFVFASGLNMFPVIGAASTTEFEDLCGSFSVRLSKDECDWLDLRIDDCEGLGETD